MVHAMGPTGTEGPFKIACEVALGLMRNQKDVLMSALRPFYFDPLLDWVPDGKHKKNDTGRFFFQNSSLLTYNFLSLIYIIFIGEVINEKAVETLKGIENKLNGLVEARKKFSSNNSKNTINLPLSVAGQVQFLIKEATTVDNLSQMYQGWAPWY